MTSEFIQLSNKDDSWEAFCFDWKSQCEASSENFDDYAVGTFAILNDLIKNPEVSSGVFSYKYDGVHQTVCQINVASLPKYTSPVMRVRFLTLAPDYDFGVKTVDEYADALVGALAGIIVLSNEKGVFNVKEIKFHLRSPSDQPFFKTLGKGLNEADEFSSVQTLGSWLHITKS